MASSADNFANEDNDTAIDREHFDRATKLDDDGCVILSGGLKAIWLNKGLSSNELKEVGLFRLQSLDGGFTDLHVYMDSENAADDEFNICYSFMADTTNWESQFGPFDEQSSRIFVEYQFQWQYAALEHKKRVEGQFCYNLDIERYDDNEAFLFDQEKPCITVAVHKSWEAVQVAFDVRVQLVKCEAPKVPHHIFEGILLSYVPKYSDDKVIHRSKIFYVAPIDAALKCGKLQLRLEVEDVVDDPDLTKTRLFVDKFPKTLQNWIKENGAGFVTVIYKAFYGDVKQFQKIIRTFSEVSITDGKSRFTTDNEDEASFQFKPKCIAVSIDWRVPKKQCK